MALPTPSVPSLNTISSSAGQYAMYGVYGLLVLVAIVAAFFIVRYFRKKKNYNIKVGIKIRRASGMILQEFAKGRFDAVSGIVDIKRKRLKTVPMEPFDVRKFLQGTSYLEVEMISPQHFIPIIPTSYDFVTEKYIDEKGNEREQTYDVLKIETDLGKRKVWKTSFERAAKDRFTLSGFFQQHQWAISMVIIIVGMCIGFAVLYTKVH
jgi:hypothetical protein